MKNEAIYNIGIRMCLQEMLEELNTQHLEVSLIPMTNPPNPGACIRKAISHNPNWYQELCSFYIAHSNWTNKYKKQKTLIHRRSIIRILERLIKGYDCDSKYKDFLLEEAKKRHEEYERGRKEDER